MYKFDELPPELQVLYDVAVRVAAERRAKRAAAVGQETENDSVKGGERDG